MNPVIPLVSVIIPCRNEAASIDSCLASIAASDWPKESLEVLVVDGQSDDGTRTIVVDFVSRHPHFQLLDNPKRIAPAALNVGIAAARGSIIVRMDAHNDYPPEYLPALVRWLQSSGADNVGGVCITRPANNTSLARAIAVGLSHPLGVGNSYFRIGVRSPCWVDTVPFGCYRREIFDRIGLFDEELVRNQDDEFNHRLIKAGGRILLVPEIVSYYHARDSLPKLWRMYYQYGYFKPLVLRKLGRPMTLRQFIPALFVISLMFLGLMATWYLAARLGLAVLLGTYASAVGLCSLRAAFTHGWRTAALLAAVFPTLHLSYGLGYLQGILHLVVRRRRRGENPALLSLSR